MPHSLFEKAISVSIFSYAVSPNIFSTDFPLIKMMSTNERSNKLIISGKVGTKTPKKQPSIPLQIMKSVFLNLFDILSIITRYPK